MAAGPSEGGRERERERESAGKMVVLKNRNCENCSPCCHSNSEHADQEAQSDTVRLAQDSLLILFP